MLRMDETEKPDVGNRETQDQGPNHAQNKLQIAVNDICHGKHWLGYSKGKVYYVLAFLQVQYWSI